MNDRSIDELSKEKGFVQLGAGLSIAVSPFNRDADNFDDANNMVDGALTQTFVRGLFARCVVCKATMKSSDDANEKFCGKKVSPKEIIGFGAAAKQVCLMNSNAMCQNCITS